MPSFQSLQLHLQDNNNAISRRTPTHRFFPSSVVPIKKNWSQRDWEWISKWCPCTDFFPKGPKISYPQGYLSVGADRRNWSLALTGIWIFKWHVSTSSLPIYFPPLISLLHRSVGLIGRIGWMNWLRRIDAPPFQGSFTAHLFSFHFRGIDQKNISQDLTEIRLSEWSI